MSSPESSDQNGSEGFYLKKQREYERMMEELLRYVEGKMSKEERLDIFNHRAHGDYPYDHSFPQDY